MEWGPLVECEWLAEHLRDPALRIFDATTFLIPDPEEGIYRIKSGRSRYLQEHIPGAGFLDLGGELSDPANPLPFTMPDGERFAAAVGSKGVGEDSRVVLYSAGGIMWATRVWWMFRAFGFDRAAVLNGGWERWKQIGGPAGSGPSAYPPAEFTPRFRPELIAGRREVLEAIGDGSRCTLNALSPEVYAGTGPIHSGRPGHIPGSLNLHYEGLLDAETGRFLEAPLLRERLGEVGALESRRVIVYCGGGIASTVNALALHLIGHRGVAVYDGSLREWAGDPDLPLVTGDQP